MPRNKSPGKSKLQIDPSILAEWLDVGLTAKPANRAKAEKHIREAYRLAGQTAPQFFWVESPLQGIMAAMFALNPVIRGNFRARDLSWDPALDKIQLKLENIPYSSDYEKSTRGVLSQLWRRFILLLFLNVDENRMYVRGSDEIFRRVIVTVHHVAEMVLGYSLPLTHWRGYINYLQGAKMKAEDSLGILLSLLINAIQGHLDGKNCWLDCFIRNLHLYADKKIIYSEVWTAFDDELGKPRPKFWGDYDLGVIKSMIEANKFCGCWWPLKEIVIATEKHSAIHLVEGRTTWFDESRILHCENDMAVKYPDGWGVYAWKGIQVPEKVIMWPELLTIQEIDMENDSVIRRIMLERFGWERYLTDSGAKLVHRDEHGVLYRREPKDDEPVAIVKVKNKTPEPDGSFKDYFLRVPPEMETARQASAWVFAMEMEEYKPDSEIY